jgi:HEAT repeat protein
MVGSEDMVIAPDAEPEVEVAAPQERKELTPEERERVKPVGEFIMDLAKAMLRSGYYSSDHPGAQQAKTGLYESLLRSLGDKPEIMLVNQETRDKVDVLISGILEEPVSVRTVVGQGMAELFVPRLRDFFTRKGLVSFALKREITPEHFDAFVDIMSDPHVDRGENAKAGELLTNSLVKAGISEISTVFMDDMILFEVALPWRVEMAIHRLAKDLKVLPMFKGLSAEEVAKMKVRIVEDIVRPLQHPDLLKDILVHCHVIARNVKGVDHEELEKTIIASFPLRLILPTSRFIFDDLTKLRTALDVEPDNAPLERQLNDLKRVLKHVAQRMVTEDVAGVEKFLEQLFFNNILTFAELPPEVQYRVNTVKLVRDVREHIGDYLLALADSTEPDDVMVVLRSFKRVLPGLVEENSWEALSEIARGAEQCALEKPNLGGGQLPDGPVVFVFAEFLTAIAESLDEAKKEDLDKVADFLPRLGPMGVQVMLKALTDSKDRRVRKMAIDGLCKLGELARPLVRKLSDDSALPWFVNRNAVLILGHIGQGKEDRDRIRRMLRHKEARVREEALNAVVRLEGPAAEPLVVAGITDPDAKMQRRALAVLANFQPPSPQTISRLLEMLAAPVAKNRDEATAQEKKTSLVARALGAVTGLSNSAPIESALIAAVSERVLKKSGLFSRLRRTMEDEDEPWVALAAIDSLARIGGPQSLELLGRIGDDQPEEVVKKAREAETRIKSRAAK